MTGVTYSAAWMFTTLPGESCAFCGLAIVPCVLHRCRKLEPDKPAEVLQPDGSWKRLGR